MLTFSPTTLVAVLLGSYAFLGRLPVARRFALFARRLIAAPGSPLCGLYGLGVGNAIVVEHVVDPPAAQNQRLEHQPRKTRGNPRR